MPQSIGAPAHVLPFPKSPANPVTQTRRCGRLPKSVIPLWRLRNARNERQLLAQRIREAHAKAEFYYGVYESWFEHAEELRTQGATA